MKWMVAAILAALLLAGCSSTTTSPPTATPAPALDEDGNPIEVEEVIPNGTAADNVNLHESGDVQGKFSKDFSFDVKPGYQRFDVALIGTEPTGTGFIVGTGIYAQLIGGRGDETFTFANGSPGDTSFSLGNANDCLLCFDGVSAEAPVGPYHLHLETSLAVLHYDLQVTVEY